MQKIIIDTNIFVSALISSSYPSRIIYDLVLTKKVKLCISKEVFEEYFEVLNRNKFDRFHQFKAKADIVISKIEELGIHYFPKIKVEIIKDLSDNKFLELASESAADYLITGNSKDFTITEFEYTKVLSPKTYWENFRPY